MPDTATRGPAALKKPNSQIGIKGLVIELLLNLV